MLSTVQAFFVERPLWISVPLIVAVSIATSVAVMFVLIEALDHGYGPTFGRSLTIAIVAPALVSAPIGGFIVHLLRELKQARDQALAMAWHDELTGLVNRRRFSELGRAAFGPQGATRRPIAALMIDIDDFKLINDRHGHAGGDQLLRALGHALRREARSGDLLARWGGEEFAVLMPDTPADVAQAVAERARVAAKALRVPLPGDTEVSCTVSVGVTVALPEDSFDTCLDRADQAMYGAKLDGKDRHLLLRHD